MGRWFQAQQGPASQDPSRYLASRHREPSPLAAKEGLWRTGIQWSRKALPPGRYAPQALCAQIAPDCPLVSSYLRQGPVRAAARKSRGNECRICCSWMKSPQKSHPLRRKRHASANIQLFGPFFGKRQSGRQFVPRRTCRPRPIGSISRIKKQKGRAPSNRPAFSFKDRPTQPQSGISARLVYNLT